MTTTWAGVEMISAAASMAVTTTSRGSAGNPPHGRRRSVEGVPVRASAEKHLVGRGDELTAVRVVAGEDPEQRHLHRQALEQVEDAALLVGAFERLVEKDVRGL